MAEELPQYSPFLLKLAATPFVEGVSESEAEEARAMLALAMGAPRRRRGPRKNVDGELRKWLADEMALQGWSNVKAATLLAVGDKDVTRYLAGKNERSGRPLTKRLKEKMRAAIQRLRAERAEGQEPG